MSATSFSCRCSIAALLLGGLQLRATISRSSREITLMLKSGTPTKRVKSHYLARHGTLKLRQLSHRDRSLSSHLNPSRQTYKIAMTSEDEPLDLYDIAVLLNYERSTTEPRFRHTKFVEAARPGTQLQALATDKFVGQDWNSNARTWIFLDGRHQPSDPSAPDLPATFASTEQREKLQDSGETDIDGRLETIFHQARNHDGCYQAIGLVQIFFNLFSPETKLRIRHISKGKQPGESYITTVSHRMIIEESYLNPKVTTAILVSPSGLYVSGNQPQLPHGIVGFFPPGSGTAKSFFDLSSMQFGDMGRGPGLKGNGLFALDTAEEFAMRMSLIATGTDPSKSNRPLDISGTPVDDWLAEVALRVKQRWENRKKEHWCGHCGAPGVKSKCSGCGSAWYCGKKHQELARPFHKGYCSKQ
jgi:hypothetical protein